ncbi:succinate dehydrogenase, hydrophobic membrane anchor protein [Octadecabacter sp.]|nr:succinate dehydrogenase, hydrophobic membrane anchor protein [Octadecabacter sp.]
MNFRTDRKNAVGLGSGRAGTHHHWQMMVSSILVFVLVPIFIITFAVGLGGSFEEVQAYFSRPFPVIITALTLIVGIIHMLREAQSAIEDYMHGVAEKLTLIGVNAFGYTLIAIALLALIKLAL